MSYDQKTFFFVFFYIFGWNLRRQCYLFFPPNFNRMCINTICIHCISEIRVTHPRSQTTQLFIKKIENTKVQNAPPNTLLAPQFILHLLHFVTRTKFYIHIFIFIYYQSIFHHSTTSMSKKHVNLIISPIISSEKRG